VTVALPLPGSTAAAAQWSIQPLAVAAAGLLTVWYLHAARRQAGWPARRTITFLAGIVLLVWTTCGFPQAYARSLYWVWTAQTLSLMLAVPIVLMAGQPHQLARRTAGERGRVEQLLRSRAVGVLRNPLVGPAVVLVMSVVLFFGPVPGWTVTLPPLGWVLQLLLVAIGALIALPLVDDRDSLASLAVGLALAIGMVELILDAIPGIVLRLSTHPATSYFTDRHTYAWSPQPLHDQQIAGAILWCVAEAIDLPFLALVFLRWIRADRNEAAREDAILDAERTARAALNKPTDADAGQSVDPPWWLTDPTLRDRFRH
jgi:cytochrome c oxidase assembly factor CtaG